MVTDITKSDTGRYTCPVCFRGNPSNALFFQGIHILADCNCEGCNTSYFHTLPIAHAIDHPISFSRDGKQRDFNESKATWLAVPLVQSMTSPKKTEGDILREEYTPPKDTAIFINCLDDCFGHVFTKLCNISVARKKHPEAHIIALLPEKLRWLIPPQLDEAWLVPGPLKYMQNRIGVLDDFVKEEVGKYDSFYIYPTSVYADASEVDFTDYLHVAPFNYSLATRIPRQVTFILREDRFWHSGGIEESLYMWSIRFKLLDNVKAFFCKRQNKRVQKTARKLLNDNPSLRIAVAGIGTHGKFPPTIEDQRQKELSNEDERSWLDLYANSHVVAGIHGSNMILPGLQAATMVELVPDYKQQHIGETTLKDYPAKNMCEHVLGYCTPQKLAGIIQKKLDFLEKSQLA